jgi:hypothetical protein
MRFHRISSVVLLAAGLVLLTTPTATGKTLEHVFVRAKGTITQMALDRSGRAAWVQVNANGECYRIHRGRLLQHENVAITQCYTPQGPLDVSAQSGPVVASARTAGSPLHIAWAERMESYSETLSTVWVPAGTHGRARIAHIYADCGTEGCGDGGRTLGPMASRDGIVLYAVNDVTAPATCDPTTTCNPVVTGGRIRWIHYAAAGVHATTIPGAPAAAKLVTAGGRLAEQTFTPQGVPTQTIQIRVVATGALVATITANGTIDNMAMSQKELAVLTTAPAGRALIRYNAATGAVLGSTPLPAAVDRHTLAISGTRILYQTPQGMFVYRIDLGRSISLGIGPRHTPTIDQDGVRWITLGQWTVAHGGPPSAIRGIELG